MNLKVIDNQLLPVYQNDQNQHLVNARELHEFLDSRQDFTTWVKARIEKYDFVEDVDFTLHKFMEGKVWKHDYILTIDTAKEIAMVENNDKGRQVRKYFIELEKRYKVDTSKLSPELKMFKAIFDSVAAQQLKVNQLETRVEVMQSNLLQEHKDNWREYINKVLKAIGYKTNDYQGIRQKTYKELENRAKCNLKVRLENLKTRALLNDKSFTYIKKLNHLDIFEDENRLREIYLGIIREYAVKYGVEVN